MLSARRLTDSNHIRHVPLGFRGQVLRSTKTHSGARQRTAPDEFLARHRAGAPPKAGKISALCPRRNAVEPPLSSDVLRTRKAAKGNTLPRRSTRNAILEAAMKQFIERGFSACSVEDITKAARVPKGSFYNHFKSKQLLA